MPCDANVMRCRCQTGPEGQINPIARFRRQKHPVRLASWLDGSCDGGDRFAGADRGSSDREANLGRPRAPGNFLDEDLADLYGVETRVLVQQVKRNAKRFPEDFMFQLTSAETEALRSQIVISNEGRGGSEQWTA
jgi:hypothetical protein